MSYSPYLPGPQDTPRHPIGPVLGFDPRAPFGRDAMTGEPFGEKSKVVAGLLQIFLGTLGVGRFYMGSPLIGGLQLGLTLLGWVLLLAFVGVFLIWGVGVWALIDGVLILAGRTRDGHGRLMRS